MSEFLESVDPSTGAVIGRVPITPTDAIPAIVARAQAAQPAWAELSFEARGAKLAAAVDALLAEADELGTLIAREMGKPVREGIGEVRAALAGVRDTLREIEAALAPEVQETAHTRSTLFRDPYGVAACIAPWNFPLLTAHDQVLPALAAGNAVVFKPSENTPLSALALAEIYTEAGLPDGLFNVVQGFGDVGGALISHPVVAKVSLTGSVPTGRKVLGIAGSLMKHATMELGGKSPLIIFDDADVENAVGGAMLANFYSTGQVCSNGTRVFVQNGIYERFVERLTQRTAKIKIGDPLDPQTQMGPLINKAQHDKVTGYIRIGQDEGATLHHGGGVPRLQGFENGFYVEPTIFTGVKDDMRIAREEIFGPVMSILTFSEEDEVIARANDTEFGLSAGVFTRDLPRAHRVIAEIKAGSCWINHYNLAPAELPFGGFKQSGIGRENSLAALDHYSQLKSVYVETGDVESPY